MATVHSKSEAIIMKFVVSLLPWSKVTISEFDIVLQLGAKRPAAGLPKVVDKKAKTETPNKPGHPCFPYFCLQMVKVSFENNFMSQR